MKKNMNDFTRKLLIEEGFDPDRYVVVHRHKDWDILTLKEAIPSNGDSLDYIVVSALGGIKYYKTVGAAIQDIDNN